MRKLVCYSMFVFVIIAVLISGVAYGAAPRNPGIGSPVGSAAVPPSSIRSGLVRTPNPIDRSSNLVITGNVGGGRHFRGDVPYNAISDFGGRLGSTDLDSFLRRSAGSNVFQSYGVTSFKPTPYYSDTGTVTRLRYGGSGRTGTKNSLIMRPLAAGGVSAGSIGQAYPEYRIPRAKKTGVLEYDDYSRMLNIGVTNSARPLSLTPAEMERLIAKETEKYLEIELGRRKDVAEQQKKTIADLEIEQEIEQKVEEESEEETPSDEKTDVGEPEENIEDFYQRAQRELGELELIREQLAESSQMQKKAFGVPEDEQPEVEVEDMGFVRAKAAFILAGHKDRQSYTKAKFDEYMKVGAELLKEGKFYKAVNAYTLAEIYDPANPHSLAGRAHALFAAGEYISSWLFLTKVLEAYPQEDTKRQKELYLGTLYADAPVSFEDVFGGNRDVIESRIADIEARIGATDADELHFLLAYVYYRLNKFDNALESLVRCADEDIRGGAGYAALKDMIESAKSK